MNRHVLTLDLREDPGVVEAYREHHDRIWPEVVRSLEDAGVRHLDIYLLGRRLVMIVDLEDGLDLRRVFDTHAASGARVAEWERLMKTFQKPAPGARDDQWWAEMEPVYQLRGRPAAADPLETL